MPSQFRKCLHTRHALEVPQVATLINTLLTRLAGQHPTTHLPHNLFFIFQRLHNLWLNQRLRMSSDSWPQQLKYASVLSPIVLTSSLVHATLETG